MQLGVLSVNPSSFLVCNKNFILHARFVALTIVVTYSVPTESQTDVTAAVTGGVVTVAVVLIITTAVTVIVIVVLLLRNRRGHYFPGIQRLYVIIK